MRTIKPLTTFTFGGLAYGLLEIFWRGETHISMFLVGGLCFLIISVIDTSDLFGGSLILQAPLCALCVTAIELASGIWVNRVLGLGVWDYSDVPLNFMGQICLPFSAIWLGLSIPAALAARLLRHLIFGDELPPIQLLPRIARPVEEG